MKKLLLILVSLCAIAAVLFFMFRKKHQPAVDQEISKRLSELVYEGSKGLYRLQIDSLVANVVDSKLTLYKARLIPDTTVYEAQLKSGEAPPDIFQVSIDQFSIDDISPVDFVSSKEINLRKIYLKNPQIHVVHRLRKPESEKTDSLETIYQRLQSKVSRISIDSIRIEDAGFTYENRLTGKVNNVSRVSFLAADFLLDAKTQKDTSRFLFARNCSIGVRDYSMKTADSLYSIGFDQLVIETAKRSLLVDKVKMTPRVSAAVFYKNIGHQQDRFTISVDKIAIRDIGWWKMLADEAFQVDHLVLDKALIDVYNDRTKKPDTRSKMGKYPQQLLLKLAFGFSVDTIAITNSSLTYNEIGAKTGEKGSLQFTNLNGRLLNVTNDSFKIARNPLMKADLNARFMQEAPVQAGFSFNLAKQRTGDFGVALKLGSLSKEAINKLTLPLGPARIDDLKMKSLTSEIQGNARAARGTVRFEYEDLKVSAMKNRDDTLVKKKLLSFIANTFILKSANPLPGKPVRIATVSYRRDPQKSFFNLVWKTLFTGVKTTAGVNK